jgi:hypothetical protein
MPSKPRPTGADTVFGVSAAAATKLEGGTYDPQTRLEETI